MSVVLATQLFETSLSLNVSAAFGDLGANGPVLLVCGPCVLMRRWNMKVFHV